MQLIYRKNRLGRSEGHTKTEWRESLSQPTLSEMITQFVRLFSSSNMQLSTLILFTIVSSTASHKILAIFPHFGISHWFVFRPLVEELAARGHQVTVVSPFPRKTPIKNYEDVSVRKSYPPIDDYYVNLTMMESLNRFTFMEMIPLLQIARQTESAFEQEEVLALANRKFDLVIAEQFITDVFLSLAYKIQAPVVTFSSHQITGWSTYATTTPDLSSYVAHHLAYRSAPFNFLDRLLNILELMIVKVWYLSIFVPGAQNMVEKHFPDVPSLIELSQNVSLILLNTHFSLSHPRPFGPNVVEVGGINVLSAKSLPQDLMSLVDKAKEGVIYFSLGTVLRASTLLEQKRKAFIDVFSGLKQTVLWKWDGDMNDKPSNVHFSSWFPQRDLLAHKNVVLFISHCGNLGVNEAVNEGIPIICIPMFGDQPYNAKNIESQGMGQILDFYSDITYDKIKSTIEAVLSNPSYSRNAKRIAKAFQDRPMTPLQTAVFWVEYVIRQGGAHYIRPLGRMMPWYSYHNYDVIVFLHVLLFVFMYSIFKALSFCIYLFSCSIKPKHKTKQS